MQEEINEAIELLNKNGYVVAKVSDAQLAMAKTCTENKSRCNFNLIGIKCVDLVCIQDLIKEQLIKDTQNDNNE